MQCKEAWEGGKTDGLLFGRTGEVCCGDGVRSACPAHSNKGREGDCREACRGGRMLVQGVVVLMWCRAGVPPQKGATEASRRRQKGAEKGCKGRNATGTTQGTEGLVNEWGRRAESGGRGGLPMGCVCVQKLEGRSEGALTAWPRGKRKQRGQRRLALPLGLGWVRRGAGLVWGKRIRGVKRAQKWEVVVHKLRVGRWPCAGVLSFVSRPRRPAFGGRAQGRGEAQQAGRQAGWAVWVVQAGEECQREKPWKN